MRIPAVYKEVLHAEDQAGGIDHTFAVLNVLSPSFKKTFLQTFIRASHNGGYVWWKKLCTFLLPYFTAMHEGGNSISGGMVETDWQGKQWDTPTLCALCKLPVHLLVKIGTESGAFSMTRLLDFVGVNKPSEARKVDLVRALLATVPVPVLCSALCSIHNSMSDPPFLSKTSYGESVGLLHYSAAMIASRYIFFAVGMPEMRPQQPGGSNGYEQDPCDVCLDTIMKRVENEDLLHDGLLQAMKADDIFTVARGGWSRFDLFAACTSTNRAMQAAFYEELGRCPRRGCPCRELVNERGPIETVANLHQNTVSMLGRMTELIKARDIDIARIIDPYNVDFKRDVPSVMHVLEHMKNHGMLMDFVQDIYVKDKQLGYQLACVF